MSDLASKIRSLRESKGMTQEELGSLLGYKSQTIYKYEKGIVENIPIKVIAKMAKIFDVPPQYLTGWHDDQEQANKTTNDVDSSESEDNLIATTPSRIGKIIHDRRIELGLTLEQVGDQVGVGKSTVRKWETGLIQNMRRNKISLLADALHISPAELIDHQIDLSNEEENLISVFRSLSPAGQQSLIHYAEFLATDQNLQKNNLSQEIG